MVKPVSVFVLQMSERTVCRQTEGLARQLAQIKQKTRLSNLFYLLVPKKVTNIVGQTRLAGEKTVSVHGLIDDLSKFYCEAVGNKERRLEPTTMDLIDCVIKLSKERPCILSV